MSFLHFSVFYIHLKTYFKAFYLNCFKRFHLVRILFTVFFYLFYSFWILILIGFRLLDEVLFFRYRSIEMKNPVFIISNPRSGTTYLHRLLCLDEERFAYTLLYHTILPSVSLLKVIDFFGYFDRKVGSPIKKVINRFSDIVFGGWKDIHPMGINQSEEDEGIFQLTADSPGLFLLCPYLDEFPGVKFLDRMPVGVRKKVMGFYLNSLKRFMYCEGKDKLLLSKNVMSTGRLQSILEAFPDARIVYLVRHPYQAVPSMISMFTGPWTAHSRDIKKGDDEQQAWGRLAIDYYLYFFEQKDKISPKNLITVPYTGLIAKPYDTVMSIYSHFGIVPTELFKNRLQAKTSESRTYKSKHSYSLEEYGMSKEMVHKQLQEVFETYGFEIE